MISRPLIGYVLASARRDRLYLALLLAIGVVASLAMFVGSSAVIESGKFVTVFTAGGLRLAGAAGLIFFTVFYVRRAFEARDVEFILSRPVSRSSFILSWSAAFSVLAVITALATAVALWAVTARLSGGAGAGLLLWASSLAVEFIIIVNAALFFSMVLSSATAAALSVSGFYVLSRMIGELLGIIHAGTAHSKILGVIMQTIALVVPRLDLLAQSSWLIYGPSGEIGPLFIAAQGVLYVALLVSASAVDLSRRQF